MIKSARCDTVHGQMSIVLGLIWFVGISIVLCFLDLTVRVTMDLGLETQTAASILAFVHKLLQGLMAAPYGGLSSWLTRG